MPVVKAAHTRAAAVASDERLRLTGPATSRAMSDMRASHARVPDAPADPQSGHDACCAAMVVLAVAASLARTPLVHGTIAEQMVTATTLTQSAPAILTAA